MAAVDRSLSNGIGQAGSLPYGGNMRGEIITRRHLPHWYVPGAAHFVTYRLAGTIPVAVMRQLRDRQEAQLKRLSARGMSRAADRQRVCKQFFAAYDRYLDCDCKIDWLSRPEIAALIRRNLYRHDGAKYHLLAYCVMPNHVHVLLQPIELRQEEGQAGLLVPTTEDVISEEVPDARSPLARIMHSLKSYTGNEVNRILKRSGQLWQHKSYDHWVRDDEELERIVDYIAWNPVKAKLVGEPHQWFWSAAHDCFLRDGSKSGWLGFAP
jgi:putative transposase